MRSSKAIFSAVQFLILVAFFSLGALFLGLYSLPQVKQNLVEWIIQENDNFLFLGQLILGTAFFLTLCFWAMNRQQLLRLQMKGTPFFVDEDLIRKIVAQFWKEEFPEEPKPKDVYLARQRIEIVASPPKGENWVEELEQVEKRLAKKLSEHIGYEREFFVSLTTK